MFKVESGGLSIAGKPHRLPDDVLARVKAGEPPGFYSGLVQLSDGRRGARHPAPS